VMANAWDAGSAAILAEAGMAAIATTSAGVAHSQVVPDQTMSLTDALQATRHRLQNWRRLCRKQKNSIT